MAFRSAVVAYDISNHKVRRRVHKVLQAWRVDGQLSVHECRLAPEHAEELFLQIGELMDASRDRLLLVWVAQDRPQLIRGRGEGHPMADDLILVA